MSDPNVNNKLAVKISIAGIQTPAIPIDLTKNDAAEDLLEQAIVFADFGDAYPGDGNLDVQAVIKVRGFKIPVTIELDVV